MLNSVQQPRVRLVTVKVPDPRKCLLTSTFPARIALLLHGGLYFYLYDTINGSDPYSLIELSSERF